MAEHLDSKLVIAVTSSALFDLSASDAVFRAEGVQAYRSYQRAHEQVALAPGAAFPLVRRLLGANAGCGEQEAPVEVVLLSRNDPDTGLRVLRSIEEHGLPMSRAIFMSGRSPFRYAQALGASLFLSTNLHDVRAALACGVPAGRVCPTGFPDDVSDGELRVAFDFDGVLADDASEEVYQAQGLEAFHRAEREQADVPVNAGPLVRFCRELSALQRRVASSKGGNPARLLVRTAIVTSRGAPAHTRVLTTLRSWGIDVDEAYFLGGLSKQPILAELRPHIFFDDQLQHIEAAPGGTPCAHVPFGVANRHLHEAPDTLASDTRVH